MKGGKGGRLGVNISPSKDALTNLRQFLEIESPLKMMKNAFHFTLKALLVVIFKFSS